MSKKLHLAYFWTSRVVVIAILLSAVQLDTVLGQEETKKSPADECAKIRKQTENLPRHILLGLKSKGAPNEKLWEWIQFASFAIKYKPLLELTGSELCPDSDGVLDCCNYALTIDLRNRLKAMADLRWLKVRVRDSEDAQWLSNLPELRGLLILSSEVDVTFDFRNLEELKNLEWLFIRVDGKIAEMPTIPSLEFLSLFSPPVNSRLIQSIGILPQLRVLGASGANLEGDVAKRLVEICPNIEVLDLYRAVNANNEMVEPFSRFKKLRFVQLGLTEIDYAHRQKLQAILPNCVIDTSD